MTIIASILFLLFPFSYSLPREEEGEILDNIKNLETRLSSIESRSSGIPTEELNKASQLVREAKISLDFYDTGFTRILVEKASYQVEFLDSLIDESMIKKEFDEKKEFLQKMKKQTEELKTINAQVVEEINKLEPK
jgi:hypothetical protein